MLCLAQKHFNQVSERKTMNKKWLYSVGVGALLMASEALGITVHEVLSNGFWSGQPRKTVEELENATVGHYRGKVKKEKYQEESDGSYSQSYLYVVSCPSFPWRAKQWYDHTESRTEGTMTENRKEKVTVVYNDRKEKKNMNSNYNLTGWKTDDAAISDITQTSFRDKAKGRNARPTAPYVVDNSFQRNMESFDMQFYGTEETATTNIISDTEAVIKRTVRQSGYLDQYYGYVINAPSSLLRACDILITTDADHVYVNEQIRETYENDINRNGQTVYDNQYTATFKNDVWKGSTQTITKQKTDEYADWYKDYLKSQSSKNTR